MKLIEKTMKMNEETFTPEMEVTLRLSLENILDLITTAGHDSAYPLLGKELVDLIYDEQGDTE
jgi:hypothetical protein